MLGQKGHALLLHGASGLGQFELAEQLARAWLCEAQPEGAPPAHACGACASCHAIDVRTHPDLFVLLPEQHALELGWATSSEADAPEAAGKRKPSREIRVDAMRAMITFSQRTDSRGRGKVVLVYPAENMNAITANALLKTLEEPPGGTRFVLASDAANRLLPTIRSRCHSWAMQWPSHAQAIEWLAAHGLDAERAAAMLTMAGGRPADALALAHSGISQEDWLHLPQALRQGRPGVLASLAPAQAIVLLQKLCHDMQSVVVEAAPRYFNPVSLQDVARAVPTATAAQRQQALDKLGQWAQMLLACAQTSEHPYTPELMTTALVEQARIALNLRFD